MADPGVPTRPTGLSDPTTLGAAVELAAERVGERPAGLPSTGTPGSASSASAASCTGERARDPRPRKAELVSPRLSGLGGLGGESSDERRRRARARRGSPKPARAHVMGSYCLPADAHTRLGVLRLIPGVRTRAHATRALTSPLRACACATWALRRFVEARNTQRACARLGLLEGLNAEGLNAKRRGAKRRDGCQVGRARRYPEPWGSLARRLGRFLQAFLGLPCKPVAVRLAGSSGPASSVRAGR